MNYKTILVAMLLMAMTIGTVSAWNPNAITIRDCVQEGVLSPLPTPVDTSRYWLTQNTTGVIDLNEDGSYVFTVNPALAYYKKGNLYFYDTNGVRHATSITVYPCEECPAFVEQNEMYDVDGSWFEITNAPAGTWHDRDANGDYTRRAYLWTCNGSSWTSQICYSTTPIPSGSVVEVRSTNLETGNIISTYAYM